MLKTRMAMTSSLLIAAKGRLRAEGSETICMRVNYVLGSNKH